jgi:hypothetical protein
MRERRKQRNTNVQWKLIALQRRKQSIELLPSGAVNWAFGPMARRARAPTTDGSM